MSYNESRELGLKENTENRLRVSRIQTHRRKTFQKSMYYREYTLRKDSCEMEGLRPKFKQKSTKEV